jgi:hypothetical protein
MGKKKKLLSDLRFFERDLTNKINGEIILEKFASSNRKLNLV